MTPRTAVFETESDSDPTPGPVPLERPLPRELTGSHHGWFTRYRIWPVYSAGWMRGRLWPFGTVLAALLTLGLIAVPTDMGPGLLIALPSALVNLAGPLLLGPTLALWVRRRGWVPQREFAGLLLAMLVTVAAIGAFNEVLSEPIKQRIAESTGQVDEKGQRRGLAELQRSRELTRAQAQRREAELRLSVLAAQVEPHFLFNTLAGVRSAITTDPPRAAEMIDRLVDYLRAAIPRLRSDGAVQATLGAQLDIVRAYLSLMAARMPRLQWRIDVPTDLLAAPFPPLMLISLAENAVKHGCETKIGPVQVVLRARRDAGGRLEVSVEDDGAGFGEGGAGGGIGLANIRERLQQMHGDRAALSLKARSGGGVVATIVVPNAGDGFPSRSNRDGTNDAAQRST